MNRIRGISLLEVLLVLSIAASIMVLTTRYFALSRLNLKTAQSISQMQKITSAAYQWLETQKQLNFNTPSPINITDLTALALINSNDMIDPWGGSITIAPDSADKHYVTIYIPGAPMVACVNLQKRLSNIAHDQITDCTSSSGYHASF